MEETSGTPCLLGRVLGPEDAWETETGMPSSVAFIFRWEKTCLLWSSFPLKFTEIFTRMVGGSEAVGGPQRSASSTLSPATGLERGSQGQARERSLGQEGPTRVCMDSEPLDSQACACHQTGRPGPLQGLPSLSHLIKLGGNMESVPGSSP